MSKLIDFVNSIKKIGSFASKYRWLARPVVSKHPWTLAYVTMLNFFGVLSKASIIAVLAYFLSAIQESDKSTIPGTNISIVADVSSLVMLSGFVFTMLLVGSAAIYYSSLLTRRLGRYVHLQLIETSLNWFQGGKVPHPENAQEARQKTVLQVSRNAVQMGIAFETIVLGIRPALYIVGGTVAVIYLDPMLTLMVAPLALVVLPFVFAVSRYIHSSSKKFYHDDVPSYGKKLGAFIKDLDGSSLPRVDKLQAGSMFCESREVDNYLSGFDANQLANEKMAIMVSVVQSFLVVAVVFIFGYYSLTGIKLWGEMLAYVMAIFYVVNNFQVLIGLVANLNRFYPQLVDCLNYFSSDRQLPQQSPEPAPANDGLRIVSTELYGGDDGLDIVEGEPIFMLNDVQLSRSCFVEFAQPLLNNSTFSVDDVLHADFVTMERRFLPGNVRDNCFGLDSDKDLTILQELISKFDLDNELALLPEGLKTDIDEDRWNCLSGTFRSLLRLLPVCFSSSKLVIIDGGIWKNLTVRQREVISDHFVNRVTFVLLDTNSVSMNLVSSKLVVAMEGHVVGIGDSDWYEEVRENVEPKIKKRSGGGDEQMTPDELLF